MQPRHTCTRRSRLVQGRAKDALEAYECTWARLSGFLQILHRSPPASLLCKRDGAHLRRTPDAWRLGLRRPRRKRELDSETYEDLQELAERFHDWAADPRSELRALRRDARSLYEALIAPVEQHLAPDVRWSSKRMDGLRTCPSKRC